MNRAIKSFGAAALAVALGLSTAAVAQTTHRHARHLSPAGRQIVVHARESYLTAGPGGVVGTANRYSNYTISAYRHMPEIDHTFAGQRGLDRLPNNFTIPGCCGP
jgi:hypothetical protein